MKSWLQLALLLAPAFASASDGAPDYQVEVNPNVYSPSDFADKNVKTGTIPPREKRRDALPDKKDRESVFARVPGLAGDLAGLDELDRDVLFVRAKNRPLTDLKKLYPKISAQRLALLKKECGK